MPLGRGWRTIAGPMPDDSPAKPDRALTKRPSPLRRVTLFLAVAGPGIVVMLADTDVGSIITSAQSGVEWGYKLLPLQFVLIPILYVVQELTVRLGIFTGKGHGELIRDTFGPGWAWISVSGLLVATIGALLTEFSGIAAVGEMFNVPRPAALAMAVAALVAVVWTGSYRRVEGMAIVLGLFEFAFVAVALDSHPHGIELVHGMAHQPLENGRYLYLVAANIGAVIMPWMIFYQQSAVVDKGLRPQHYPQARWDTALGAILTQLIMAAVLVATAATIGKVHPGARLDAIGSIADALVPFLGPDVARLVFGLGTMGAALVAAIVVSLASAWGVGEVVGFKHSLEHRPQEAPWFYAIYAMSIAGCAVVVAVAPNLVALNIGIEVMNALLLPLVLGFLVLLAFRALPEDRRLRGAYGWIVITTAVLTAALGIYGAVAGIATP